MDGALVGGAGQVVGDGVDGDAVDVCVVRAATQLLDLCPAFCVVEADQGSLYKLRK